MNQKRSVRFISAVTNPGSPGSTSTTFHVETPDTKNQPRDRLVAAIAVEGAWVRLTAANGEEYESPCSNVIDTKPLKSAAPMPPKGKP